MEVTKSKREIALERRSALKDLCNNLKLMVEMGQLQPSPTTNGLLRQYYEMAGHKDLHTFNEWKELGYHVKKGEKAILFWGTPKATKEAKEAAKTAGQTEEEAKEDYFPLTYLFSSKQVEANEQQA